jgi:phage host-nuclease inhibitor protein Gam
MKKNTTLLLITVAMLSTSPLGHAAQHENDRSSANEAKQEVADAAEGIKDYSVAKRDEAVKKGRKKRSPAWMPASMHCRSASTTTGRT